MNIVKLELSYGEGCNVDIMKLYISALSGWEVKIQQLCSSATKCFNMVILSVEDRFVFSNMGAFDSILALEYVRNYT